MSPRWLHVRVVLLVIVVVLSAQCIEVDPAAPAAVQALTFDGPEIVRYPVRHKELSRYIVRGVRDGNGGCAFHNVVALNDGEVAFESVREINPLTCESIVARHPLSELPAHARPTRMKIVPGMSTAIRFSVTSQDTQNMRAGGPPEPRD